MFNVKFVLPLMLALVMFVECGYSLHNKSPLYRHRLILYECDLDEPIYQFCFSSHENVQLDANLVDGLELKLSKNAKFGNVTIDKSKLNSTEFDFSIKHLDEKSSKLLLTVVIKAEIRKCISTLSKECTIVIIALASISLLLFAGLAISLIVIKQKQVSWLQNKLCQHTETGDNYDLEKIGHSHNSTTNGIKSNEEEVMKNMNNARPRKSSLKPPRTEAFLEPIPIDISNTDISLDPSSTRRKSIVTFNERTEIRI